MHEDGGFSLRWCRTHVQGRYVMKLTMALRCHTPFYEASMSESLSSSSVPDSIACSCHQYPSRPRRYACQACDSHSLFCKFRALLRSSSRSCFRRPTGHSSILVLLYFLGPVVQKYVMRLLKNSSSKLKRSIRDRATLLVQVLAFRIRKPQTLSAS